MIRPNIFIGIVFALTPAGAWAQVGAPLLGYLPNGGHIQPVYGIPASAGVAAPVDYGRDFRLIAVSPLQDFSIATDANSGTVLLALPAGGATRLTGVASSPDRIVLSPRGSAAALWFSSTSHLQIVSGLPGSPLVREMDATFLSNGTAPTDRLKDALSALAVSDDGQWVVGSWSKGLYAFGPQGEVVQLPVEEHAASLTFFAGRQDLALASATHIFSITAVGGAATVSTVFTGVGLDPVGMALSSDNGRLVLAERSGTLLTLNLSAGSTSSTDCGCAPEGVYAMGVVFRLTGITGGVFKLFDAASGEVLLVPLALDAFAGGQQ